MKKLLIIIFTVFFAAPLFASGGEAFAFLKNGVGVRAAGMGGAYSSLADDCSASFYNPAGLGRLHALSLAADTYIMSFGRSMNFVAVAKPFEIGNKVIATGFSWINYSTGADIEARASNTLSYDSVFNDAENMLIASFASSLSDNLLIGANAKFLFQNIKESKGAGFGFDVGAIAKVTSALSLGINFSNISTSIVWSGNTHTDELPLTIVPGISYILRDIAGANGLNLLLSADVYYNKFNTLFLKGGLEGAINDVVFARCGWNGFSLSVGTGIKIKPSKIFSLKFDYAWVADSIEVGGANHRIGLTIDYIFPGMEYVEQGNESNYENEGTVKYEKYKDW